VLHHSENPPENDYINIDVRVFGKTLLLGYIQLL